MMCNKRGSAIYGRGDKGMLGTLKMSMLSRHERGSAVPLKVLNYTEQGYAEDTK